MASTMVGAGAAAGLFAGNPLTGAAFMIGAALVDNFVLAPALRGKGRENARAPRLFDVPSGSNQVGAPRTWAIGPRVRVPCHVLWQALKSREQTATSSKAGTTSPIRRVYFDSLIALNDRQTLKLKQLIGNGKLLLGETRNLIDVRTSEMVVSVAAGRIVLSINGTDDPDFADRFAVGDVLQLGGFIVTAGNDLNAGYWRVQSVTSHAGSTASVMHLDPFSGQTVAGTTATAGMSTSPAVVTRIDDVLFTEGPCVSPGTSGASIFRFGFVGHVTPEDVFQPGDQLVLENFTSTHVGDTVNGALWRVLWSSATELNIVLNVGYIGGTLTAAAIPNPSRVKHASTSVTARGVFPAAFDPATYYHDGADDQAADALLIADKGAAETPAFRGVACQGLDSFFAEQFGDQMPFALEAILEVDSVMTWGEALTEVIARGGIERQFVDTGGVDVRPFAGCYLRGAVPTITAMQPLLIAGQIVGQERDGVLCLFDIHNADVVQIQNGDEYSDLGAFASGDVRQDDKILLEEVAHEDLPTSIGVRHQDPDNQLAEGYQSFGLRNPGGVEHTNEQEVDISNLVVTRKQAKNLATTLLRRAHVNRHRYTLTLPVSYAHLLENDLVTVTDDDGEVITARVIERTIGSDWLVHVVALAEDVDLAVSGSPVQSAGGSAPLNVPAPASLRVELIDAPAVDDHDLLAPSVKVAVCADLGGFFAGAALYVSADGSNFDLRGILSVAAAIGTFTSDAPVMTASEAYGTTAVTFRAGGADVEWTNQGPYGVDSVTQTGATNGANWCAIMHADGTTEIAAFTTVTPIDATNSTLTEWLRGLRGTTPRDIVSGAKIVMLRDWNGVHAVTLPGLIQPTSLAFKVVPAGKSIDDVETLSLVSAWRNMLPLPVRSISKTIGATPFDARFTIDYQWCRPIAPLGTQPPHPMDEPIEGYRLTIYDPAGLVVKRIKTKQSQPTTGSPNLRDKWFDYPASEQTADGYTPSAVETFVIDIQQIGHFGLSPSIKQEL